MAKKLKTIGREISLLRLLQIKLLLRNMTVSNIQHPSLKRLQSFQFCKQQNQEMLFLICLQVLAQLQKQLYYLDEKRLHMSWILNTIKHKLKGIVKQLNIIIWQANKAKSVKLHNEKWRCNKINLLAAQLLHRSNSILHIINKNKVSTSFSECDEKVVWDY